MDHMDHMDQTNKINKLSVPTIWIMIHMGMDHRWDLDAMRASLAEHIGSTVLVSGHNGFTAISPDGESEVIETRTRSHE